MTLVATSARADEPDTTLAVLAGSTVLVGGFTAGGVLLATSGVHYGRDNAGWLTIESGFTLAPLVAHAVTGELPRGFAFASLPAAATAGTAAIFAIDSHAVRHGVLTEQRILWPLFGIALLAGTAGVVDAAFADGRAKTVNVTPTVGSNHWGIDVWGVL
jgi:hypothetical protein